MRFTALARTSVIVAIAWICSGCSYSWWNAFLDPTQPGNFRHPTVVPINTSISVRDTPSGYVGVEDPKPSDLVATVEEYTIGPSDLLQISLLDFMQLGTETPLTLLVNESGNIDMPLLGRVKVEGYTDIELQKVIIQLAKDKGIYNPDSSPIVTVTVTNPMQRMYYIEGAVYSPYQYRIPPRDFRLREAITLAGGTGETTKWIRVVRNAPRPKQIVERPAMTPSTPAPGMPVTPGTSGTPGTTGTPGDIHQAPSNGPLPAPPVTPVLMSEQGSSVDAGPHPSGSLALPANEVPNDLIEAVRPSQRTTQTSPAGANGTANAANATNAAPAGNNGHPTNNEAAKKLPSYKFVNGAFIEEPAQPGPSAPPSQPTQPKQVANGIPQPPAPPSGSAGSAATKPADWEELANEAQQQRIILIPADKLRSGNPNYNIVIRPNDWIHVDPGPMGFYIMRGHINRPGQYPLGGEQISLKQAVGIAGDLGILAWPTRCEITRRLDGDREEVSQFDLARIMDGKDPDLYLKSNDIIVVGTHAIAPLLATIRNSFRFTYGFGFVYDRNFADIDSFSGQVNPYDRRRAEKASRFGNLSNLFN